MRIVFVQIWHSEKAGYSDRFLPAAMARQGHDVHLVSSDLQPYFNLPGYQQTYGGHLGPPAVACGTTRNHDGVWLHRLPHAFVRGHIRLRGLFRQLRDLRPDIVQAFALQFLPTFELALYKPLLGYRLFVEARVHRSVCSYAQVWPPLRTRVYLKIWANTFGRLLSASIDRCHPISLDCAEIATRFFGIHPRKVSVAPLGSDTALFHPPISATERRSRTETRARLGFGDGEIVCIYTGRLTRDKGPKLLAQAVVRLLAEGLPYRALFIGAGAEDLVDSIRRSPGCVVHPFVAVEELPAFYRAADIGVWPMQESTSQIDAAACGLPLVVSDQVAVRERVDGNGLTYRQGDFEDLAEQLKRLHDPSLREQMGEIGARRMAEQFDWNHRAAARLAEYAQALGLNPRPALA